MEVGVAYLHTPHRDGAKTTWTREPYADYLARQKQQAPEEQAPIVFDADALRALVEKSKLEAQERAEELEFEEALEAFCKENEAEERRQAHHRELEETSLIDQIRSGRLSDDFFRR